MDTQNVVKKRLLVLHATYQLGGAERVLQLLSLQLRSRFDLHVCALYQPGEIGEQIREQGVPFYALRGRSRTDMRVLPRFFRLMRQIRPDVLLTIDAPYAMLYAVLARRLHLTNRLVIAVHSFGKIERTREISLARRLAAGATDILVALAETHRRFLLQQEGWHAREVVVIPNGVDLNHFHPQGNTLHEEWELSQEELCFGVVAAMRPEKNLFRFLRVAREVLGQYPTSHAFLIGDGPLRPHLERYAQELGLEERIHFTGARQDIPAVWRTLDVAVLTSEAVVETLPMTLIEAAACGVPAVSTDVGAVRDIVIDGKTGFLVPVDDEKALAERILYLLQHPDARKRMGAYARQYAEAHFDLRQMVERYAQVLGGNHTT